MDILVIISQALLYVCYSLLVGSLLLHLVPAAYKPEIAVPAKLYTMCAIAIPFLTFIPILKVIFYVSPRLGFGQAFKIVLTTYEVGTAWDITLAISFILITLVLFARNKSMLEDNFFLSFTLMLTFMSMLSVAWASHAAAVTPIIGIVSNFLHLLAVSIWVGVLLVISWFSTNTYNWLAFLKWFPILAISCLALTAISGLFLMDILVNSYTDAWVVSYGTGLFLKHLFILPLIFYALFNSIFVKYKVSKDSTFNPLKGVRIESLILLMIFTLTAIFTQQPPPHGYSFSEEVISPIFRWFNSSPVDEKSYVGFVVQLKSVLFFFTTVIFTLLAGILSFFKKTPIFVLFICICLAVSSLFSTIFAAIAIR